MTFQQTAKVVQPNATWMTPNFFCLSKLVTLTKQRTLEDLQSGDQQHESHDSDVSNRISVKPYPVSAVTLTPCKDKGHPAAFPSIPVSPITGWEGDETSSRAKKTHVLVTVEWPRKTKDNVLHEGLESLGKMLCHGTYKQIAGAVWRNPILKKHLQRLFLHEVDHECTALCSLKNPSCLRSPKRRIFSRFCSRSLPTNSN